MLLEFPVSTLINASGLLELDLSKNNISTFTNQHLKNLINLQFLSLSWNRLTFEGRNESSIFTSLPKLSSLDLSHNNIHKLFNGMFMKNSLITLDMSFNNISEVESESFRGLVALETLHLNHNNIRTLPSTVFELLSNLKELDISYNNLVKFDDMKIPASLSLINLNTNNIQEFPNSFNGSYVSEVDLNGNSITSLPLLRLKGINNIKGLNLARNALKIIEENAFNDASSLQNLNLENNELNLIFSRDIFKGANSLSHLNLADNKISTVDNIFDIESLRNLKVLNIKKNDIVQIKSLSSNVTSDIKIESILLSECKIKYIADAFRGLKKLKLVDLNKNDIQTFPTFLSNPNAVYNLTENPIICACNMSWLSKDYIYVNGIQISTHAYKVKYCSVYPNNWTIEVKQVQKDEYLCPKEDCCDKTACCSCFSRDTTAIEVAVCKSGLQIYPWNATRNSRVVYLDGHNFHDLFGSNSSLQMANEELYLNSSFISAIHASFMMVFTKLKILDLHNNQIQTLPSMLFKHQGVLQYLYLSHNHISVIQKGAFEGLNSLLFLDLSYNKFHYVNPDSFSTFSSSLRYKLGDNPLECDCKNKDFKQWIQRYRGRIIDRYDIVCAETGKHILYADLKICDVKDSGESSLTRTNVIILVVILAVVIAVISTVCFYYRRDLVAILYDVTGVGCFRQKNYGNKLNDIYLSYDSNDSRCSEWVDTQLLPRLKARKNGYRIIVPDRKDLHDSVTNAGSDAILSCKCCIILVSKNMHTNDVCLEEFRKAYNFSLTNPLYKVILVIFGTVDILSLEPEMRQMMSKGDYITARSRTVWSRIRFELPNPNTSHFNDDDVSENDVVLYSATDNYQYVTLR
uniref:Toll-like receptor n=1 Tax=Anadara kagoshimensis TaxID=1390362 RepID=A0A7H0S6D9_9BIVA|nr:toll-like receptor [Anadara sativa]